MRGVAAILASLAGCYVATPQDEGGAHLITQYGSVDECVDAVCNDAGYAVRWYSKGGGAEWDDGDIWCIGAGVKRLRSIEPDACNVRWSTVAENMKSVAERRGK